LARLEAVDCTGAEDQRGRLEEDLFALPTRIAWLGSDDEDEASVALWVRPHVAQYAADVLSLVCGPQLQGMARKVAFGIRT
jgi:hypothetical protein